MKHKAKIVAVIFACLFVLAFSASCGNESSSDITQGEITKDTVTFENRPNLFEEGTWYEGRVFSVLVCGNGYNNDFSADKESSDIVERTKYNRVRSIREKYGVDIQTDDKTAIGSSDGNGTGYRILESDYYSEDKVYDTAQLGTYDAANAACHGYLSNLNSDSFLHLDLSKPWWNERANRSFVIDGMIFYTTGDISLSDKKNTYCILYNKDIQASTDMRDPYEMVKSGEWTWENFSLEVKRAAKSVQYGLETDTAGILAAFSGVGGSIAQINEKSKLALTAYSQSTVVIIEKYTELLRSGAVNVIRNKVSFENQIAAYLITTVESTRELSECKVNFGYLPIPKMSTDDKSYLCLVSPYYTQFVCVPYYVKDKKLVGGILEELAYLGKATLTDTYAQSLLGESFDKRGRESLDIIFASASYDVGINYKLGGISTAICEMSITKENTFADIYSSLSSGANKEIKEINEGFNNISKSLKYQ